MQLLLGLQVAAFAVLIRRAGSQVPLEAHECAESTLPAARSDFPAFLNCLGLTGEAVEVGVQAGVHASAFLEAWQGRRLRLVDTWDLPTTDHITERLYVDIANTNGHGVRRQHRALCEERLKTMLTTGRAEILDKDSVTAAASMPDGSLDFVYLDARHDFAGVVADVLAWWPKVKVGGIFAGHDFVDGEFPEGDFFWISALKTVLPAVTNFVHVTQERLRYPSFFVQKSEELSQLHPVAVEVEPLALRLYAERSHYFRVWRSGPSEGFTAACQSHCGEKCAERAAQYMPAPSVVSTLRPFKCTAEEESPGSCAREMVVEVNEYMNVCLERCNLTCDQRSDLFAAMEEKILLAAKQ
mmetsp:Transcript_47319/g.86922  ORF Transcript_47319/g.86922 Transcript_47319/m.86922 type:complete len:355 (+) Transcript_47319:41-1105(+)